MLSSQRKKLQLKHYDALHMLVEKFTIHNLSAPHKYGIWDSKENYAYGTWAHIPQPRNALILGEEKTPYLSTLIIAINEGGKPCVWGKVKVLPNFFYGTKLVPPKALGKKCSSWHYSVKSTGHSSLWRYPLIRMCFYITNVLTMIVDALFEINNTPNMKLGWNNNQLIGEEVRFSHYTLNSVVSHLWQPKSTWYYKILPCQHRCLIL